MSREKNDRSSIPSPDCIDLPICRSFLGGARSIRLRKSKTKMPAYEVQPDGTRRRRQRSDSEKVKHTAEEQARRERNKAEKLEAEKRRGELQEKTRAQRSYRINVSSGVLVIFSIFAAGWFGAQFFLQHGCQMISSLSTGGFGIQCETLPGSRVVQKKKSAFLSPGNRTSMAESILPYDVRFTTSLPKRGRDDGLTNTSSETSVFDHADRMLHATVDWGPKSAEEIIVIAVRYIVPAPPTPSAIDTVASDILVALEEGEGGVDWSRYRANVVREISGLKLLATKRVVEEEFFTVGADVVPPSFEPIVADVDEEMADVGPSSFLEMPRRDRRGHGQRRETRRSRSISEFKQYDVHRDFVLGVEHDNSRRWRKVRESWATGSGTDHYRHERHFGRSRSSNAQWSTSENNGVHRKEHKQHSRTVVAQFVRTWRIPRGATDRVTRAVKMGANFGRSAERVEHELPERRVHLEEAGVGSSASSIDESTTPEDGASSTGTFGKVRSPRFLSPVSSICGNGVRCSDGPAIIFESTTTPPTAIAGLATTEPATTGPAANPPPHDPRTPSPSAGGAAPDPLPHSNQVRLKLQTDTQRSHNVVLLDSRWSRGITCYCSLRLLSCHQFVLLYYR